MKDVIHVISVRIDQVQHFYNVIANEYATKHQIGNTLANDKTYPEVVRSYAFQYDFNVVKTTIEPFPDCIEKFDNSEYRKILE